MTDRFMVKGRGGAIRRTFRFSAAGLLLALLSLSLGNGNAWAKPVQSSIVIDVASGGTISAVNPDTPTYPASLTKMMTLYMLFEALRDGRMTLDKEITFSRHAASRPATNLSTGPGDRIRIETAILAVVVRSANDAATAIGEALGGTESAFAVKMTKKARALGMSRTVFRNASGLPDPGQRTTARDMATLGLALLRDFPQYYRYFSRQSFTYHGVTYAGHNRLLGRFKGADGIKTGYIRASGFNLVSSAKRGNRRLIGVVMGGPTASIRDQQMVQVLERGFVLAAKKQPTVVASTKAPKPSLDKTANQEARAEESDSDLSSSSSNPDPVKAVLADDSADSNTPQIQPEAIADEDTNPTDEPANQKVVNVWSDKGDDFGIQVGAFSQQRSARNAAHKAAKMAPSLLSDARIVVDEQHRDKGDVLYRARLLGLSREAAERSCSALAKKGADCLVIKGDHSIAIGENVGAQ